MEKKVRFVTNSASVTFTFLILTNLTKKCNGYFIELNFADNLVLTNTEKSVNNKKG